MKYLAVIPARGGSKGIPGKNLYPIAGCPLIAWTIGHALQATRLDRTLVSTDDAAIAAEARAWGAEVPFLRPAELARDTSPTEPSLIHAVEELERTEGYRPDAVVLLQATSAIRLDGAIDRAIAVFEAAGADSLLGVCENHHFFWRNPAAPEATYDFRNRPRRQDITPDQRLYRETGSIYITRTEILLRERNRLGGRIAMFAMDEIESYEIDSLVDMRIAETLLHEVLGNGSATPPRKV